MNRNSNQMRYEPRLYVYIRAVRVGGEKKKKREKKRKEEGEERGTRDVENRLNREKTG